MTLKNGLGLILYVMSPIISTDRGITVSELSLRLPKSMYEQMRELSQEEGISMNQFVLLAIAEKIAALMTVEYLETRAKRGSREKFLAVLAKAPDVEPEEYDRL